jgi:hypothetical protein
MKDLLQAKFHRHSRPSSQQTSLRPLTDLFRSYVRTKIVNEVHDSGYNFQITYTAKLIHIPKNRQLLYIIRRITCALNVTMVLKFVLS